jgi:hypothetical protein
MKIVVLSRHRITETVENLRDTSDFRALSKRRRQVVNRFPNDRSIGRPR